MPSPSPPTTCISPDRWGAWQGLKVKIIFLFGRMIFFHPYRERSKCGKLFFIYGAEDMTLLNKSNSLLPVKVWTNPCIYPLRIVSCFVYSCYQQWVFFHNFFSQHWVTRVWAFYWSERSQDIVLQRCKAASRESLHWGPAEWGSHMDQKTGHVCKMHPPWFKALYICRIILMWLGVVLTQKFKVPILKKNLSLVLNVTGTSSGLLTFSM